MVPAEVGEGRDGEGNGVDAAQRESVGGDLHRHGLRALLAEVAEQALQIGRLRRGDGGSGGLERPAVQGETDRSDHPGPDPGCPQRRVEQVGWWWSCRWFRSPRTWSWPGPASRRSPPRPGPSPGVGRRPRRAARPALGPARHRPASVSTAAAPACDGLGSELDPVVPVARQGDVEIPGGDQPGVMGDPAHQDRAGRRANRSASRTGCTVRGRSTDGRRLFGHDWNVSEYPGRTGARSLELTISVGFGSWGRASGGTE